MYDHALPPSRTRWLLAIVAAVSMTFWTISSWGEEDDESDLDGPPPPCEDYARPNDVERTLWMAECHANEGNLAGAVVQYEQYLAMTAGKPELENERNRVRWILRRIIVLQEHPARPDARSADTRTAHEDERSRPAPLDVIPRPPAPTPRSGGPASCQCEAASGERDRAWCFGVFGLAALLAWLRRTTPALLFAVAGCASPPGPARPPAPTEVARRPATNAPPEAEEVFDRLEDPIALRCPDDRECKPFVRISRHDGAVEPLDGGPAPKDTPLLVDQQNVYWGGGAARKADLARIQLDWRPSRVRRLSPVGKQLLVQDREGVYLLPKDGSRRTTIPLDDRYVLSAALGKTIAAWVVSTKLRYTGMLEVLDAQWRTLQTFADEDQPTLVHIADDRVFWAASISPDEPKGKIRTLQDGNPVTLVGGQYHPTAFAVVDGYLYWVNWGAEGRSANRVPVDGGQAQRIGIAYGPNSYSTNTECLVVHGGFVYWNDGQSVVRAPIDGGPTRIVVTVDIPGDVISFTVDDDHIYVAAHIFQKRQSARADAPGSR